MSRKKVLVRLRRYPRRHFYAGLGMLFIGVVGFYVAITHTLPFLPKTGTLVTAYFSEPNQLQAGSTPVRIDGIQVGSVDSVNLADGGRAGRVVLRITNSTIQLHSDAGAAIKFRTLLGANFVVDLTPGSASAPLLGNQAIPLSRTTVQSELDDVLRVFNNQTGLSTRVDLKQLSKTTSGSQLGTVIDLAAPTLAPTPEAFNALRGEDPGDLASLVSSAADTTRTLGADRQDLETLIAGGSSTLSAVAGQRRALSQALADAPAALDSTVDVSHSIETTVPPLNRLLSALAPGARALGPAAAAARPTVKVLASVLDRADPLLHSLRPAISELSAASVPGTAVLNDLLPTFTRLNTQLLPWLQSDDSALKLPIYQLIGPTAAAFASVAGEYDANSHVIHFPVQPELNSLTLVPCTVLIKAPTPSQLLNCTNLNQLLDTLLGATSTSATSTTAAAKR